MTEGVTYLHLAHWRRRVAELYAQVRHAPAAEYEAVTLHFRRERDRLFYEHPQSPLTVEERQHFTGLNYFPYDTKWRIIGEVEQLPENETFHMTLPEGTIKYTRIARIHFAAQAANVQRASSRIVNATLNLYWIEGYGGGLFLPFKDATNGAETYGGGRYLYDTIKGADLGAGNQEIVLDFNYAYNPSCAYSSRWVCPLSPPENTLPFRVAAGEKVL